jgi:VWFA-related protein
VTSRYVLSEIARATGGSSFLVANAGQLERIYDSIEEELRSQYLIGYQSNATDDESFREIELRVARPDLEVKTIPGYYP